MDSVRLSSTKCGLLTWVILLIAIGNILVINGQNRNSPWDSEQATARLCNLKKGCNVGNGHLKLNGNILNFNGPCGSMGVVVEHNLQTSPVNNGWGDIGPIWG